jgi:hypothetical protein
MTVNGALYVGGSVNANTASTMNFGGTTYVAANMTLGKNNISAVSDVIMAHGNILLNNVDNGNYSLIEGIIAKQNNGVLTGLTAQEIAFLTGVHSIIISEAGNFYTVNADNVAIAGFIYVPNGNITTYHWFAPIGAMYATNIAIDDIRQIMGGSPFGGEGSAHAKKVTVLTWEVS